MLNCVNICSKPSINLNNVKFFFLCIYIVQHEFTKILLLSETHRRPIGNPSETYRRPNGDRRASLETHRRPACLIRDPSETDMPYRRPIGDRHTKSETNMPHRRPKCFIEDRYVSSGTHKNYISCLI